MPTRSDKAAGILERQDCMPLDDGHWQIRNSVTGSGRCHLATATSRACYDSRKGTCKHQIAVRRESQLLTAYSASWDCWAAAYRPCCPQCGAQLETAVDWIGGKGYCSLLVCSGDGRHPARMV